MNVSNEIAEIKLLQWSIKEISFLKFEYFIFFLNLPGHTQLAL